MEFQHVTFQKSKRWGKAVVSINYLGKNGKKNKKGCNISSNYFHLCCFGELNLYSNIEPKLALSYT